MTDISDELDDAQVLVVDGDVRRIETFEADQRGRINLGSDYADETVRVAVIDSQDDD
jgi:hypothetical protein